MKRNELEDTDRQGTESERRLRVVEKGGVSAKFIECARDRG